MKDEQAQDAPLPSPAEPASTTGERPIRLRLRSLKVHAFRDIRPGTELRFGDGPHLILGKNGTGKSTLLELLAAVSTLNFRKAFFDETPFHVEASLEVGEVLLHAEIRRSFESRRIRAGEDEYMDLPSHDEAEFIIRVEQHAAHLCRWVRAKSGEDLCVFDMDPRRDGAKSIPFNMRLGGTDPLKLSVEIAIAFGAMVEIEGTLSLHPEAVPPFSAISKSPGVGDSYDEALGALQAMTGSGLSVVRGKLFPTGSPWLPPPLDFNAGGEPVVLDLAKDPLLKIVIEKLGYDAAKAYFGPGASSNAGWTYSSPSFQFFRNGKAVRRHDQLSFGQKRLFSFAWYLACNPDVAIADELVNGLHADWIDWCVEALADRQCFLTSQNPLLVDEITFASDDDLQRGIILCEATHDDARDATELSFRQLTDRETDLIGNALRQSRLDLLSDLLRALDLW